MRGFPSSTPTVSNKYFQHRAAGGGWSVWYKCNNSNQVVQSGNAACNINTLYAVPFVVPAGGTIDDVRMYVIGAGGGNCRVGVYEATSITNLYPGALILDCGTFAVNAGGIKNIGGLSLALTGETLYWMAYNQSANWTSYGIGPTNADVTLGYDNTAANPGYHTCSVALAYAAMPAAFPGGAALLGAGGENMAGIWYHLSA